MSDRESQLDELCALESIYNYEEFRCADKISGQFDAFITVPAGFTIIIKDLDAEDESDVKKIPLRYLPPISLSFELPPDYPSKSPPNFTVGCLWMPPSAINKLKRELLRLWELNKGMEILFIWSHFLKEEALEFLNIADCLDLSKIYTKELKQRKQNLDEVNHKAELNQENSSQEASLTELSVTNESCSELQDKSNNGCEPFDILETNHSKQAENDDNSLEVTNKQFVTLESPRTPNHYVRSATYENSRYCKRTKYLKGRVRSSEGDLGRASRTNNWYRVSSDKNYSSGHKRYHNSNKPKFDVNSNQAPVQNENNNYVQTNDTNNKENVLEEPKIVTKEPGSNGEMGTSNSVPSTPKSSVKKSTNVTELGMHLHDHLIKFNEDRAKTEFGRNMYTCNICFEDKLGVKCTMFKPCEHVYCRECISGFFIVRINEGCVMSMPCPQEKCSNEASQTQIRELVGPANFLKYDILLLKMTLNQMEDITYCPRTACQCPVVRDQDEKLATCISCHYVFCVYCRMTYHGIEPCRLKDEEKKSLIDEYNNGDEETRRRMERRYGKRQMLNIIQSAMSENWISENSKPCPSCSTAIEKSKGCNKMICWKCNAYFCWLCGAILDPLRPYKHFYDSNSKCINLLFEGMVIEENEEEEDELYFEVLEEDEEED